jgi:hypothetical protein
MGGSIRAAMPTAKIVALAALLLGFSIKGKTQNSENEFRPRVQTYVSFNQSARLYLLDSFENQNTGTWQGDFGAHLDFALKPIFRRDLRAQDDVFRRRYLSFLVGYRYITNLPSSTPKEQRALVELTTRRLLPWQLVVSDRNRGEFRFIRGQSLSERYRNRLQIERDFSAGKFVYTPYLYGEVFYDTRYDAWTRTRYAVGVQIPVVKHLVLATYYLRQHDTRSEPPHTNAWGLDVKLYF